MPRKTTMRPGSLSAKKISPLGAVLSQRGLSRPEANNSTLKPAGAIGKAFGGRATTCAPFCEDSVAKGAGKSFTVILRIVPGFSKRKSVNGGLGAAALNLAPGTSAAGVAEEPDTALPELMASTKLTTCHRLSSGSAAHDGIPLSLSPLVMNQKISPAATPFSLPSTNEGTLPVPCKVFP